MIKRWTVWLCFLVLSALPLMGAADVVKKSGSGICHGPQSPWYDVVKNYQGFESLRRCTQSGGRLPKGTSSTRQQIGAQVYSRAHYGNGWADEDRDCQDTRNELLIERSTAPVRFTDASKCRVLFGRWISPFTNEVIHDARQLEADHLVPLFWSWRRGASEWSDEQKETFANDPANVLIVESLNQSKSDRGPDQWLPPEGRCGYTARFTRIVLKYRLEPNPDEYQRIKEILAQCRG